MEVQALGTAFEVFDYDIESKSETVLLNGKVKIGINNSKGDRAEFICRRMKRWYMISKQIRPMF